MAKYVVDMVEGPKLEVVAHSSSVDPHGRIVFQSGSTVVAYVAPGRLISFRREEDSK